MSDQKENIRLELKGEKIISDIFTDSINAFFDLINEISKSAIGEEENIPWFVKVEKGSINIIAEPKEKELSDRYLFNKVINDGLKVINKGSKRPQYFTDIALKKLKKLAKSSESKEGGIQKINIWTNGEPNKLSQNIVKNVDKILSHAYKAYGTIEGRLLLISDKKKFKFEIYDDLLDVSVRCYFKKEKIENILKAFRKRVSVRGLINYRHDGVPISIKVDDFQQFKDNSELPSAYDVLGILRV